MSEAAPRMGLAGLRVLEFPDPKSALCGRLLADLGADVVLVEPPGGHDSRGIPPFAGDSAESLFFWFFNANKRSITLDLDDAADRERFLDLASRADVLLDPFAPGRLAKLGLDDKTLLERNRDLILISVTGFGQTGPYRDYATSDIVGWALGGLMGLTGDPDREPLTAPGMQAYQTTALWALMAILAAVYKRRRTGLGSRIDISVQEAIYDMSEAAHTFYLANGDVVKRNSGQHPLACPFMAYNAADGYAFVGLSTRQQWASLADWMRSDEMLPDAITGEDFATIPVRLAHRDEVNRAINAWASTLTKQDLFSGGAERGIPNAPLQLIDQGARRRAAPGARLFRHAAGSAGGPCRRGAPVAGSAVPHPGRARVHRREGAAASRRAFGGGREGLGDRPPDARTRRRRPGRDSARGPARRRHVLEHGGADDGPHPRRSRRDGGQDRAPRDRRPGAHDPAPSQPGDHHQRQLHLPGPEPRQAGHDPGHAKAPGPGLVPRDRQMVRRYPRELHRGHDGADAAGLRPPLVHQPQDHPGQPLRIRADGGAPHLAQLPPDQRGPQRPVRPLRLSRRRAAGLRPLAHGLHGRDLRRHRRARRPAASRGHGQGRPCRRLPARVWGDARRSPGAGTTP